MAATAYFKNLKFKTMSRRRRRSKTSRRRRVGAMALNASNPMVQVGSLAAGYFLAGTVNPLIDKVVPATTNQKLVGGAQAGLGALLLMKKGKKSLPLTVAGGVLAGAGLKRLLVAMGVVSGFQAVPALGSYRINPVPINGFQKMPVISGMGGYTTSAQKVMGSTNVSNDHNNDDL